MEEECSVELSADALEVLEWLAAQEDLTLEEAASMAIREGLHKRQEARRQGGAKVLPFCRPGMAIRGKITPIEGP